MIVLILLSCTSSAKPLYQLSDTSSPQQTINSFHSFSEELMIYWRNEQLDHPHAKHVLEQTRRTMDLSQVPNRNRTVVVMERIIMMREILSRIEVDLIDTSNEIQDASSHSMEQWRFANTDIMITLQSEGDRAGQFLFSSSSIQQLPHWYRMVEALPYIDNKSVDSYQEFLVNPGPLFSKQFIHALPDYFSELYGPLPLWQWAALAIVFLCCKILIKVSFYLGEQLNNRWESKGLKWTIGQHLSLISIVFILYNARRIIDDGIWITGGVYQLLSTCFLIGQFFYIAWLIMAIFNYLARIYAFKKHNGKHIDSSLLTVLARIAGGLTIAMMAIYAVEYLGFSISPILAGLGVSGLAVALAIRPVLENVINGLTLYADGGIKIGELCRYGDKLGTIESIGLRSTRIRTLERSLITIPNSEFANMEIDNLERRDKRRMEHTLRIRAELTQDQLKLLIVNIRRILLQHPQLEEDAVRVRFKGQGEFAILINLLAYIICRDNDEFLAVQEDVLFLIMQQIDTVGAQLAFSNQYQLAGKLVSIDNELKEKASQTLQQWHESNNYPFPDFSYEYQYEIKDTIIYPAKSSSVRKNS